MKLAQTSKLEAKEKLRIFFRKIPLLAFLLVFSVVNSIDTLKVNTDKLTREDIFKKLQLVANASEPDASRGENEQPSPKDKSSIQTERRLSINKKPGTRGIVHISQSPPSGSTKPSFKGNGDDPPRPSDPDSPPSESTKPPFKGNGDDPPRPSDSSGSTKPSFRRKKRPPARRRSTRIQESRFSNCFSNTCGSAKPSFRRKKRPSTNISTPI